MHLFYQNERFDEISPKSLYESELEALIIQNIHVIKDDAWAVPFKKTVFDESRSAQADLAIIAKDYSAWMVVEVELIGHSLFGHVIPQVRTLRAAKYLEEHADYLSGKLDDLDALKMRDLMLGDQPSVAVIYNKFNPDWDLELKRHQILPITFEIYRSDKNQHIFGVDGELPEGANDIVSRLDRDRFLPNFYRVASPAKLGHSNGETIRIEVLGQLTQWTRIDTGNQCFLKPKRRMPIDDLRPRFLLADETGNFTLEETTGAHE